MEEAGKSGSGIRLSGVTVEKGDFRGRFDLAVPAGSVTAVIGPSGSGKSTLLNVIAGFDAVEKGTVSIAGRDITRLGVADRPVSMIFQEFNLFAHLDARTNIGLGLHPGLRLSAPDWRTVDDALARVGLDGFAQRLPAALSGGERQRVALARTLVRRKPVLLLDEAFGALGPGLRAEMLALVDAIRKERDLTVLMVTHEPADALSIAEKIAFVDRGRIVAVEAAEGFFQRHDIAGLKSYLGEAGDGR